MKETWRGWQGHFCCQCMFHLNTLLEHNGMKIVVTTVGDYHYEGKRETIGCNRTFETMVFKAGHNRWDDADINEEIGGFFGSYNDENEAQSGHYKTLEQVKEYLEKEAK